MDDWISIRLISIMLYWMVMNEESNNQTKRNSNRIQYNQYNPNNKLQNREQTQELITIIIDTTTYHLHRRRRESRGVSVAVLIRLDIRHNNPDCPVRAVRRHDTQNKTHPYRPRRAHSSAVVARGSDPTGDQSGLGPPTNRAGMLRVFLLREPLVRLLSTCEFCAQSTHLCGVVRCNTSNVWIIDR